MLRKPYRREVKFFRELVYSHKEAILKILLFKIKKFQKKQKIFRKRRTKIKRLMIFRKKLNRNNRKILSKFKQAILKNRYNMNQFKVMMLIMILMQNTKQFARRMNNCKCKFKNYK